MQYCSLQHWTLLLPPDMSSTECHFLFDPATSFFSGTVSNCFPLFYSSTLNTFKPGELIFWCHVFLPFHSVYGIIQAEYWSRLPFPPAVDHVLSEFFIMPCLSWVVLHGVTSLSYARGPSPPQGSIPGKGQINGHGFEQTLGNSGQRSLTCCSPRGHKESDIT